VHPNFLQQEAAEVRGAVGADVGDAQDAMAGGGIGTRGTRRIEGNTVEQHDVGVTSVLSKTLTALEHVGTAATGNNRNRSSRTRTVGVEAASVGSDAVRVRGAIIGLLRGAVGNDAANTDSVHVVGRSRSSAGEQRTSKASDIHRRNVRLVDDQQGFREVTTGGYCTTSVRENLARDVGAERDLDVDRRNGLTREGRGSTGAIENKVANQIRKRLSADDGRYRTCSSTTVDCLRAGRG
jgi:hypothetical protein